MCYNLMVVAHHQQKPKAKLQLGLSVKKTRKHSYVVLNRCLFLHVN
jgi:hypothetical protein